MCLFSKKLFPRKAKEDIVVYKILLFDKENRQFNTPIINHKVDVDCIYGNRYFKPYYYPIIFTIIGSIISKIFSFDCEFTISRSWIHTYSRFCAALINSDEVAFKCIIPKGTLYYEDRYIHTYASRKIKFIEKL